MKKLLYIILLLPLWVNAQTNGTIQKTSATGTIRGSFGSLGLDTLPRVTGALVNGYILKYHAATNKWYASPDGYIAGLQDSLTKKANRTFNNVASGAIAKAKVDTSATGLQTVSNFFPKGDTRYLRNNGFLSEQIIFGGSGNSAIGSTSLTYDNTRGYLKVAGAITSTASVQVGGAIEGSSFVKTGGSSSQILLADGSVASGTGTGDIVRATSPTLVTPALGTPTALVGTNITGTASGLTAGKVTTNANLTGPITSSGNATSVASQTGTGSTFAMSASPTFTGTVTAGRVTASDFRATSVGSNGLLITPASDTTNAIVNVTNAAQTISSLTVNANGAVTMNGAGLTVGNNITTNSISIKTGASNGKVLTSDASGNATWQTAAVTSVNGFTGAPQINPSIAGNTLSLTGGTATADISSATSVANKVLKAGDTMTGTLTVGVASGNNIIVSKGAGPSIEFQKTDATAQTWQLVGGDNFSLLDITGTRTPFTITPSGNFTARGTVAGSNLSGTNTGDQTNITGNAGTATALQTARNISGTSFDGTADITLNNTGITNGAGYITSSATSVTNKVLKAGDTMTGTLTVGVASGNNIIVSKGAGPSIEFQKTDATAQTWQLAGGDNFSLLDITGSRTPLSVTPAGNFTALGTVAGSNLSGTNTGDNATNTTSNTYADGKVADNLTASTTVAPSKTAVNTALDLKAPLASPALTGNPTAPTQSQGDNSTKIATTAYVDGSLTSKTNRILKDWYTDANNVTTSETDLYDYTVPSNTLINNGDKLYFEIGGSYSGTANTKEIKITFGSSGFIFGSTTSAGGSWTVKGFLVKTDATSYRIVASNTDDAPDKISTYSSTGSVTNYTGTNIFKISATGGASADITAKAGYLEFKPAAP